MMPDVLYHVAALGQGLSPDAH